MAFLTADLKEETGDGRSSSEAAFSFKDAHTVRTWFMENPLGRDSMIYGIDAFDLQFIIKNVLGSTDYPVNQGAPGRLARVLPLADPLYPWLYASNIQSIKGVGVAQQQQAQLNTNLATFPGYGLFPNYEIICDCTYRPYPVSPDESITTYDLTWIDSGNLSQTSHIYPEWNRFTDFDIIPQEEWIEQQRGQAYFQTGSGNEPGNGASALQSVRMLMPNDVLRLLWVGVPLRYILSSNSYLVRFRGKINQCSWNGPQAPVLTNAWSPRNPGGDPGLYTAGSLLYTGYKPRIYQPVLPVTFTPFGSFIDYSRLCDIELYFLRTTRIPSDSPAQPTNKNIVVDGWNCQPYLPMKKFFYCYNTDLAATPNRYPLFYSFPVELLFQDPDAAGAYAGDG